MASVSEVANNFEGLVGIIAMRWDFFYVIVLIGATSLIIPNALPVSRFAHEPSVGTTVHHQHLSSGAMAQHQPLRGMIFIIRQVTASTTSCVAASPVLAGYHPNEDLIGQRLFAAHAQATTKTKTNN